MTTRKHPKKHGKSHSERPVQGICSTCGKKLNHDSALIVAGMWYCFDNACRPAELQPSAAAPAPDAPTAKKIQLPLPSAITFWLPLTISLCGIVFATVALREIHKLTKENSILRESRKALLDLVKIDNGKNQVLEPPEKPAPPSIDKKHAAIASTAPRVQSHKHSPIKIPQYQPVNDIPYQLVNGPLSAKTVSLTFDGGGSANATVAILDTLASRSVKASMFLTGEFIRKFPDLTRRIVAQGHECGNHTLSHLRMTTYERNHIQSTLPTINKILLSDQLTQADSLFFSVTGSHFTPIWRAPYGECNSDICRWGYEAGYLHVGWRQGKTWLEGLDSNDWIPDSTIPGYKSPEEFLEKIALMAKMDPPGLNGGIILMHLGTLRKDEKTQTHLLLGKIIDTLQSNGYSIIPVSQMASSAGFDLALLQGRNDIQ
jgi:peptidoglycan/xylan/chitin deacetylase (PgdA/CDA1 family)